MSRLYVAVNASRVRRWNAGGFMHLNLLNEALGFTTALVGNLRVLVQNESGQSQQEHGDDSEGKRPRDDVELRIHQPVATVSIDSEDENTEEQEN